MACSKCKKVEDLSIPEIALQYTTSETRVLGRDGEMYLIQRNLVTAGVRPRQGWGVVIEINGQLIQIKGASAADTVDRAKKQLSLNDYRISNLNLWFNLNIQWLSRIESKHQNVKLESLLALANP